MPASTPLSQRRPRYFLVVEMKRLASDDLIILVPLARDQHQITIARFGDRLVNRLGAIRDLAIRLPCLLNSFLSVAKNLFGILCARIAGGENHHTAQPSRRFPHRSALRSIGVPATAKDRDDLSLHHLARRTQHIQQRVVAVRVVNHYRKVAVMDHTLETSRRAGTLLQRRGDEVEAVAERKSTRDRRKRVVNVRWTNEW